MRVHDVMSGKGRRWQIRAHRGRVWFDRELREAHRRVRQSIPAYVREGSVLSLLTAPIIYSLLMPLVLLDIWVTIYQSICFQSMEWHACRVVDISRSTATSWRT
jgi:hypothetical protein